MGKREIPHPEISPGIIAKFQLYSVLAAESYSSSCPLGFWTGKETRTQEISAQGGFPPSWRRSDCLPNVFIEASMSLSSSVHLHLQTFILSVTAEEMQGDREP